MTIQLTKDTYVAGVLSASGSQHTLDAQTESYLVHIGAATWVETAYTQGRFEDAKIEYDSDGVATGIVGRANEVVGPVWATDDSGNVTGLVGPDGYTRIEGKAKPKIVLWGDSGLHYAWGWIAITAGEALASGGIATVTINNHSLYPGCPVDVVNTTDSDWYGRRIVLTVIDANTFTMGVGENAAADLYNTREANTQPFISPQSKPARDNIVVRALAMCKQRGEIVANLAANTQSAVQMLTHLDADLAAYPDSDLWICATVGANDVRVSNPGSVPVALNSAQAALSRIKSAGKTVLYLGWQPNNASDATKDKTGFTLETGATASGTNAINQAAQRFNAEMKRWCCDAGIDMISQFDLLVDPASSTGYALSGTMHADGVHVNRIGAKLVAPYVADWLTQKYPADFDPLPRTLIDRYKDTSGNVINQASQQLFRNPLLTVDAGGGRANGVTMTEAFGMPAETGISLVARTVADDGDAYGNNQVASWATSSAGSDQAGAINFTVTVGDIPAGTTRMQFGCMVRSSAHTQFSGVRMISNIVTSNYGSLLTEVKVQGITQTAYETTVIDNEMILSPVTHIPADAIITSCAFYVQGFATHTGGFTLACGRPMARAWIE